MTEFAVSADLEILNTIFDRQELLNGQELAQAFVKVLFEFTKGTNQKLVEVRDYDQIAERGAFKYTASTDTMHEDGLIPDDVYYGLRSIGIDSHVGPSYLKAKGLLTLLSARSFFGRQIAYRIQNYIDGNPLGSDGFIVCMPFMTGGAWIGDETLRQLVSNGKYRVWPATPYFRRKKKVIDTTPKAENIGDYVDGVIPRPCDISAIVSFEELRNACDTTREGITLFRNFGYRENDVRHISACLFDYRHPVGVSRLTDLGVGDVCGISGPTFMAAARDLEKITPSQYQTAHDWLVEPWEFTRRILPDLRRLKMYGK